MPVTNANLKNPAGAITEQSLLAFFKHHAVIGINGQTAGIKYKQIPVPAPRGAAGPANVRPPTEDDYHYVLKQKRVTYMTASTGSDANAPLISPRQGDNVLATISNAPGIDGIPIYYLPYQTNEHHRITLVPPAGIPTPPGAPKLFLTDPVDGCSVYVEGTPDAPTVSHLNANKEFPPNIIRMPPMNGTPHDQQVRAQSWNVKWGHMDQRFEDNPKPKRVAQAVPALIAGRKLESHDYMFMTEDERLLFSNQRIQLQNEGKVPRQIRGQSVDFIEGSFTQGTVFGVLDAANQWHFYVQRRVIVELYNVSAAAAPTTGPSLKDRVATAFGHSPRPAMGPASMVVTKTLLGLMWLIRSVNEFWPGTGVGSPAP